MDNQQPYDGQQPGFIPQSAVWPPPVGSLDYAAVGFPFKFLYLRLQGAITPFREGDFLVTHDGLVIRGRVVPPESVSTTVIIICWLFCLPLAIAAYYLMRYAFLRPVELFIPWSNVHQVVLMEEKQRVGVVYSIMEKSVRPKTYSLVASLTPAEYPVFVGLTHGAIGDLVAPGKFKSGTSPALVWVLAIFLAVLCLFVVYAIVTGK